MSYVRQPVGEDPLQVWGAVGALFILFLVVVWLFLPEVVYATCLILHTLWGFIDWGPFHEYAAPRYNLLAITGMAPHEKSLFAIFGLQYFLDDRKAALSLMDALRDIPVRVFRPQCQ
ncbi:hypothetical protein DMT57_20615 [Salmonella enterica]|nr:hypothetical protein [Salmonella enterica]